MSHWKYFSIALSFFSYLLGENGSVESNKLLSYNIKPIKPIKKYPDINEFYGCIL